MSCRAPPPRVARNGPDCVTSSEAGSPPSNAQQTHLCLKLSWDRKQRNWGSTCLRIRANQAVALPLLVFHKRIEKEINTLTNPNVTTLVPSSRPPGSNGAFVGPATASPESDSVASVSDRRRCCRSRAARVRDGSAARRFGSWWVIGASRCRCRCRCCSS